MLLMIKNQIRKTLIKSSLLLIIREYFCPITKQLKILGYLLTELFSGTGITHSYKLKTRYASMFFLKNDHSNKKEVQYEQ